MIEPTSRFTPSSSLAYPPPMARTDSPSLVDHRREIEPARNVVHHGRVLVASPDESFLRLATHALGSFRPGYSVATASSLALARDWLRTFKPGLVIVDLDLLAPEDSVGSLAEPNVELLIVSSDSDLSLVQSERQDLTLLKPVTLPVLLEAVRHAYNDG